MPERTHFSRTDGESVERCVTPGGFPERGVLERLFDGMGETCPYLNNNETNTHTKRCRNTSSGNGLYPPPCGPRLGREGVEEYDSPIDGRHMTSDRKRAFRPLKGIRIPQTESIDNIISFILNYAIRRKTKRRTGHCAICNRRS